MNVNILRLDIVPGGYFQAAAKTLGSSSDEVGAIERGAVSAERFGIIMDNLQHAVMSLYSALPAGRC